MALLKSFARRLEKSKFGQKSLTKSEGLSILKQQPGIRVYVGIILMVMSYLLGLPVLTFLSYQSVKLSKPMTIAVGGPIAFLIVHVMFGVGVYLAGRNYAVEMLQWATKRFLQKYK